MDKTHKTPDDFQCHILGILLLLILQFTLGMAINLFITFPSTDPNFVPPPPASLPSGSSPSPATYVAPNITVPELYQFAFQQPAIVFHVVNGGLILSLFLWLFIRALLGKNRVFTIFAGICVLSVSASISGGASFIGTQDVSFTYQMGAMFSVTVLLSIIPFVWRGFVSHYLSTGKRGQK